MSKLWAKFAPPGRPSKDDIKNYDKLLKIALNNIEQPKIVILGATPEIRNLLYKYKDTKVLCVDMTGDMYWAMNNFIKHQNPREKFIKANWLTMSKKIKDADVVIGDYVLGNISDHQHKFYLEIKRILKPGGYFIHRDFLLTYRIKKIKNVYQELVRISRKNYSIKQASACLANNLWLSGYKNFHASISYYEPAFSKLDSEIKKSSNKRARLIWRHFKNSWYLIRDKYVHVETKNSREQKIKRYFIIKQILYSQDYEINKESPIYILKNS